MIGDNYQELLISTYNWLIDISKNDAQYLVALKAFEYAKNIHTGLRKDGKTPEFLHQIEIANYIRAVYQEILYPGDTLAVAFLHDIVEDYNVPFKEIETIFGYQIFNAVKLLTRKQEKKKNDTEHYFTEIVNCPIASLIKGYDRINNQKTICSVFKKEKQKSYIEETKTYIIPMLQRACFLHTKQNHIYEDINFILNSQIKIIEYYLANLK